MLRQGRTVDRRLILRAGDATPLGVSASAVAEAGDVADEHPTRAESVAVVAAVRRLRDPRASLRSH